MALHLTKFEAGHDDLIHDIAYDYYGKRIATCSSDQKVKVYDWDDDHGQWALNDSWKAHDASVVKVKWAHPEYGQVIASCSFDRSIRIWEEQEIETKGDGKRWAEKARLVDSRGSVHDIEFAPSHLGLKLATCAADGLLRIYEAMEVFNLSQWTLMEEFEIGTGGKEAEGIYSLSWCPSAFAPQQLVVGCGKEYTVKIFRPDKNGRWQSFEIIGEHDSIVHDVAWSPNMGRGYELIATACKDKYVRIFKLTEEPDEETGKLYRVQMVGSFKDHNAEVWTVEWNITGTILASSGDDGKLRLWKASYVNEWKCMYIVCAETPSGLADMSS